MKGLLISFASLLTFFIAFVKYKKSPTVAGEEIPFDLTQYCKVKPQKQPKEKLIAKSVLCPMNL